ncbi:prepilin-type N-terminal cleavage/methylation domain-containing protein [Thermodesulfobacteriota bacterium]
MKRTEQGFTLLEVMVALSIIAIALTAVLGMQSQSLSLASEAKFGTTASLLAQGKIAEIETLNTEDLVSSSGDFGEDFDGYSWQIEVNNVVLESTEGIFRHLRQIDLKVSWGESEQYQYDLRLYRFIPEAG